MDEHINNFLCLEKGVILEDYRIEGILGKGGFAITYKATDIGLKKTVVIKELLPDGIATRAKGNTVVAQTVSQQDDFDWAINSFLNEAQTIASFEHPNLVRVLRFFSMNGTAYMVMPFIDGQDLKQEMKNVGRYNFQKVMSLLCPLLDCLELVHAQNVLHRDIKPDNIYITNVGEPILIDFGAARQNVSGRSQDITSIVTIGYAAIEQYSTDPRFQGPWSDIYGLAAVVYHLITGIKPTGAVERGDALRHGELDPVVPLKEMQLAGFPADFLDAVDRGLAVHEKERPQNVAEWREMLLSCNTSTQKTGRVKTKKKSSSKLVIALIFLLFALIGVGVYQISFKDRTTPVVENGIDERLNQLKRMIEVGEYQDSDKEIEMLELREMQRSERKRFVSLKKFLKSEKSNCPAQLYFNHNAGNVTVAVNRKTVTPKGGRYSLKGIGEHLVSISAAGYNPHICEVKVESKNQLIELGNIVLAKVNDTNAEEERLKKRREELARERAKMEEERKKLEELARSREESRKKAEGRELSEAEQKKAVEAEVFRFIRSYYTSSNNGRKTDVDFYFAPKIEKYFEKIDTDRAYVKAEDLKYEKVWAETHFTVLSQRLAWNESTRDSIVVYTKFRYKNGTVYRTLSGLQESKIKLKVINEKLKIFFVESKKLEDSVAELRRDGMGQGAVDLMKEHVKRDCTITEGSQSHMFMDNVLYFGKNRTKVEIADSVKAYRAKRPNRSYDIIDGTWEDVGNNAIVVKIITNVITSARGGADRKKFTTKTRYKIVYLKENNYKPKISQLGSYK